MREALTSQDRCVQERPTLVETQQEGMGELQTCQDSPLSSQLPAALTFSGTLQPRLNLEGVGLQAPLPYSPRQDIAMGRRTASTEAAAGRSDLGVKWRPDGLSR